MAGMNGWAELGSMLSGGGIGNPETYTNELGRLAKVDHAMQAATRERANAIVDTVRASKFQTTAGANYADLGFLNQAQMDMALGDNPDNLVANVAKANELGWRQQAVNAGVQRYGETNPNAYLMGVATGPVALGDIKDGMAIGDRFADGGGGLTVTPLGEATIRQRNASAASSFATANNANVRSAIARGQYEAQRAGTWNPSGAAAGTSGSRGQNESSGGGTDANANLNPRQQVAVQGVQRNLVQYAAALLGKEPEEMAGLSAAQIADEIRKNGGRTVQGGTARLLSRLPGGTTLGELNNVDILSYSQGAGAAWAAYENPTGIITNADRETATAQMPTYLDPPEVQARKIRSFLELSGYQPQGGALGDPSPITPAARAPAAPAAPSASYQRATNPRTGQVLELRNGQWVPAR